jgi:hypothetical protein
MIVGPSVVHGCLVWELNQGTKWDGIYRITERISTLYINFVNPKVISSKYIEIMQFNPTIKLLLKIKMEGLPKEGGNTLAGIRRK